MSLVDFVKEKEVYRNKLITEMSLRNNIDMDELNDIKKNYAHFEYIKKNGVLKEQITLGKMTLDVYDYGGRSTEPKLGFLSDKYVAAFVDFSVGQGGIKIEFTNLFRPFRRLMDKIFIEYLLPRYKIIYSDTLQTLPAFHFWQRLVNEKSLHDTEYKVFIVDQDSGKEQEIFHGDEMETTYGYDTKHVDIVYKLQKV